MGLQESLGEPAAIAAAEAASRYYLEMEETLADHEFLAGSFSLADIAFYMAQFFGERMSAPMTNGTPRLRQWRKGMTSRPAVRQVVGPMVAYLVSQRRPLPDFLSELTPQ